LWLISETVKSHENMSGYPVIRPRFERVPLKLKARASSLR